MSVEAPGGLEISLLLSHRLHLSLLTPKTTSNVSLNFTYFICPQNYSLLSVVSRI